MSADKLAQAVRDLLKAQVWQEYRPARDFELMPTKEMAALREALTAFEAAPQQAQLEKERAARQEAQSELARYKGLLASSRLDLMREMKEHGWTSPQQARAPIDPDGEQSRAGFRAFDESQIVRWASPWQVWREAVKWAAAQLEQDKLDAERYRWLRDFSVPPHNFYLSVPVEFDGVRYTPDEVDSAIDAAREMLAARAEKGGT